MSRYPIEISKEEAWQPWQPRKKHTCQGTNPRHADDSKELEPIGISVYHINVICLLTLVVLRHFNFH